jgi:GWxTD domain-containing protein
MARFFIDRPVFAWVIAILICLLGGIALTGLPVAQYPSVAPPSISITANYAGASAETLGDTVTSVIEQQLNGIDNLLYMSSASDANGTAIITLYFKPGTNPDVAQVQVQNKVQLATPSLPLRRYRLTATVIRGSEPLVFRREFRMIWPDMPRSLRNVDDAIAALRYIAPEAAIDSLLDGPLEARWAHLEGFWKPRDRSPDTAPNELMTEYYRRVDHARETFATLRQPDGFLTDRGRIYVLHGPPTNTERSLDPTEGFREVWTYARGNKTFTFVDRTKTGDYILVQRPAQ